MNKEINNKSSNSLYDNTYKELLKVNEARETLKTKPNFIINWSLEGKF